jgi:hypothetical protein
MNKKNEYEIRIGEEIEGNNLPIISITEEQFKIIRVFATTFMTPELNRMYLLNDVVFTIRPIFSNKKDVEGEESVFSSEDISVLDRMFQKVKDDMEPTEVERLRKFIEKVLNMI